MSFDPKCYDLAKAFLADEPGLDTEAARTTLASAIQDCIQDEIHLMRMLLFKARRPIVLDKRDERKNWRA